MKALLDTNIVIHRETNKIINQDIGTLFKWLDKGKYTKCIHAITISEINKNTNKSTVESLTIKLDSYEQLKTIAPLSKTVKQISSECDTNGNDINDTQLLNEVYCDRVDILITEDKKIHRKARLLNISERVFNIDSFLEKVVSENPELVNYKVLSVTKKLFGDVKLEDSFFNSFKEDYEGFNKWFNRKAEETAYVTYKEERILSFLYLKIEEKDENYSNITPIFTPKRRLKIGTFKVVSNGLRLGERFLKIIFDNALQYKVEEIYVTIFEKRDEQKRLINLLQEWGFVRYGNKITSNGKELVLIRNFNLIYSKENPKTTFPYISRKSNVFLAPIYPEYHTELLPDSFLRTESPNNFIENEPHRNAISKVYISRSIKRNINKGDVIIFYRTAPKDKSGYYHSVITTIAIVENKIDDIPDEKDFILKCRKRSVFTNDELKEHWNYSSFKPFIINFLYLYSFKLGKRMNRKKLLDLKIITGEKNELRGLKKISNGSYNKIIKEAIDESIIVD